MSTSIQSVIDISIDCAVERRNFLQALRMKWLSHANYSATLEPTQVLDYLQELRLVSENFPTLGN